MARLVPGTWVQWKEQRCICMELREDGFVFLQDVDGKVRIVAVADVTATDEWAADPSKLVDVTSRKWQDAQEIFSVVRPLVLNFDKGRLPRAEREAACEQLQCSVVTLYRHIEAFRGNETISAFFPSSRLDKGISRLSPEVEAIIQELIRTFYLKKVQKVQKDPKDPPPGLTALREKIDTQCRQRNLKPPSMTSIHRRVQKLPERLVALKRSGKDAAKRFDLIKGSFPGAERPWMVFQIDHTKIDLEFVDEVKRKNIGRGFLTIVIDVCTRMIAGFCISLDAPGALTAGIALGNALLTKDKWLAERNLGDNDWPLFGVPAKIHTDNAREFVGMDLARSCEIYGIEIEQRPKGRTEYGGTVERAFRTFMGRTHALPGTTFSSIEERGTYDSQANAVMSMSEYERWFTEFVTGHYHNAPHKGLEAEVGFKISPLAMFNRMVVGTEDEAGCGYQTPITNEEQVRLDFLPFEDITIQKNGVTWDSLVYRDNVLNPFVGLKGSNNKGRKFRFVRDPRDISVIYFLHEELHRYFRLPWIYVGRKPISKWEWKKFKKGQPPQFDPDAVLRSREKTEAIVDASKSKTVAARREESRKRSHEKESFPAKQKVMPAKRVVRPLTGKFNPFPYEDG